MCNQVVTAGRIFWFRGQEPFRAGLTGEKIMQLWQFILTNTGIIVPAMEWKPEKRLSD